MTMLTAESMCLAPCMRVTRYALGHGLLCAARMYELHPKNCWRSCCVPAVSAGPATSGENTACLLRWPCASQGRRSTSACPTVPLVCFQPLSSRRASPVFNEQCAPFAPRIPEDNWRSPTGSEIQLSLSASASYSRSCQYQTC